MGVGVQMEKKQWNRVSRELAIVIGKWVEGCIPKDRQHVIGEDEGGQLLVNIMDFLEQDGAYPAQT